MRKNSPPPGWAIDLNSSLLALSRSTSAAVAWLVSSGVGASTTTRIERRCCGNAFSNAISRCRQGNSGEISLLMSVLMAKCWAA